MVFFHIKCDVTNIIQSKEILSSSKPFHITVLKTHLKIRQFLLVGHNLAMKTLYPNSVRHNNILYTLKTPQIFQMKKLEIRHGKHALCNHLYFVYSFVLMESWFNFWRRKTDIMYVGTGCVSVERTQIFSWNNETK